MANDDFDLPRPTDAVPSATSAVINDDAKVLDYVINGTGTVTTRTGKQIMTIDQAIQGAAPVPLNGGVWASGQAFEFYNQYMYYDGIAYATLPATTLPYTVGATPDLGFVYQIKLNSLQLLSGLNEPSDLDKSYRRAATVAQIENGDFSPGSRLAVTDRADAPFDVVSGGLADGRSIIDAGNSNTAVLTRHDGEFYLTDFGCTTSNNAALNTGGLQAAVNYQVNNKVKLIINGRFNSNSVTMPDNWEVINIEGVTPNTAYVGVYGDGITFATSENGFVIPLENSNHYRCNISKMTLKYEKPTPDNDGREMSAIKFMVNGTRTFNYPIMWTFDDFSCNGFDSTWDFVRSGGVVDPDAFTGKISINRHHGFDVNNHMKIDGMYLNMLTWNDSRLHSALRGIYMTNSGGCFCNFNDTHWEGVNNNEISATGGIIVMDAFSLDSEISFHNHDWEKCGQLVKYVGTVSKPLRVSFSGRNRFNSFAVPDQTMGPSVVSNNGDRVMTIVPNGTTLLTPATINVKNEDSDAIGSGRVRCFFVPHDLATSTNQSQTTEPVSGQRQLNNTGVNAFWDSEFEYIRKDFASFITGNHTVLESPYVSGDRTYIVATSDGFENGVSRPSNPFQLLINATQVNQFFPQFFGISGQYTCVIMIKVLDGESIGNVNGQVSNPLAGYSSSIGFNYWKSGNEFIASDTLPNKGPLIECLFNAPDAAITEFSVRGRPSSAYNMKVSALDTSGLASTETVCKGVCGSTSTKSVNDIFKFDDPTLLLSIKNLYANDYATVEANNASGANKTVLVSVKFT